MKGLRARVREKHHQAADVIIGKKGLTKEVLKEIERRLEKEEIVKVKMLRSSLEAEDLDRKTMARLIAERLGARIMGIRGRTIILYKKKSSLKTPKHAQAVRGGKGWSQR